MSFEKWVEYGWLRPEPTGANEIRDLLRIVSRDLNDANVEAISDDRRFEAAFSAGLTLANVSLRACGYRTVTQVGHHQRMIETLELTIQAEPRLIQKLKVFSKKRNATSYDSAGNISEHELSQAIQFAMELERIVSTWLREHHPELI
jgi:hypothetical protein